jgi:peptide/nickel transport system substrate-binding protein
MESFKTFRRLFRGVIALGLAFLVASLAVAQSSLTVGLEIPVQLDPAFASSDAEITVLNAVYDYLVDIDTDNNIQPRLAESWSVSDDGLIYGFRLHEGVTFHDGSPLTAEDVVWTFNRLRDAELGIPTADLYSNIEAVEAISEIDVLFSLENPNPFFLYDLSDNHAVIVQAETTDFNAFNGTGPFQVVSYSPENRMELTANPNYFIEGQPGVETLEFIFFSDQAAAVNALRGGQVDLVMRMPTPIFQSLEGVSGIIPISVPTNGFDLIRLRSDREPGSDPRVVQALKLAVDRDAIVELVTQGTAVVGKDTPIGPLYDAYYAEDLEVPARDVDRARELLAEAGYPDGLSLDLHVPDTGDRPDLAAVLQQQLAEAGFNINIIIEPESVYYGDDGWLEVDFGITGWGSRPLPQFYLDTMLVCGAVWNESHFCDEGFDMLAGIAGSTLDEGERIEAYREIQEILIERGPVIIPYFFSQFAAIRDGFEGFELKAFPGRSNLAAITAP